MPGNPHAAALLENKVIQKTPCSCMVTAGIITGKENNNIIKEIKKLTLSSKTKKQIRTHIWGKEYNLKTLILGHS